MPYFYDTYAILEYLNGNERYRKYFEEESGVLTSLNLMEIYYVLLNKHGVEAADLVYSAAARFLYEFDDEDIKEAMKLRHELRKRKLSISYADALGYYLSLKLKVKFLTGDIAFEKLENTEYIR